MTPSMERSINSAFLVSFDLSSSFQALRLSDLQDLVDLLTSDILQTYKLSLGFLTFLLIGGLWILNWWVSYNDGIPIVNRRFALEPRVFSRWRWAFGSAAILDQAAKKYPNQPYRLVRGDVDVLVLPSHVLPELNKRDETFLNSHRYQCHSITGHLNELEIVLRSNFHMKVMLHRGTSALPFLVNPIGQRAQKSIWRHFPSNEASSEVFEPLPPIAQCISQLASVMLLGAPICDDQRLIDLSPRLAQKAFSVAFAMRFVPRFLERILLPLLPPKWDLGRTWREFDDIVVPELTQRKHQQGYGDSRNVASWMMMDAKADQDSDPRIVSRLIGSAFAGGIWSTSTLILGVIVDLVTYSHYLEEIREEIFRKHSEIGGRWDFAALKDLGKLDSAMKESSRRAPGSLLVYGRVVEKEIRLSNALTLSQGQHIATPLHSHHSDPELVPYPEVYEPLRWYNRDPQGHLKTPFTSLTEIGRWGSGRRACPGRFLASLCAKIMLVELLANYEFEIIEDQKPCVSNLHEFVYIHPSTKLRVRSRSEKLDVVYQ